MKKVSLYKFTYISLLKKNGQLKQKSDKQSKKKKTITQFIKKKNHVPKTKQLSHPQLRKSKKNKIRRRRWQRPRKKKGRGNVSKKARKKNFGAA